MVTISKIILAASLIVVAAPVAHRLLAQDNEKSEVEATVRNYEQAIAEYDFTRANSMLAPDARWIEHSYPVSAEFKEQGWNKRWDEYKAAKLHIDYRLRDLNTRIRGEVAWVTLALDGVFTADNQAALALNDNKKVLRENFVESYVLVKIDGTWKVALGHTSSLSEK